MNRKDLKTQTSGLFNNAAGIDPEQDEAQGMSLPDDIQRQLDADRPATPKRSQPYARMNLKISLELAGYLQEEATRQGMSRTEFINKLLLIYAKEHPHR